MKMLDKYLCHEPEAQEGETSHVVSQGEVAVGGGGVGHCVRKPHG